MVNFLAAIILALLVVNLILSIRYNDHADIMNDSEDEKQ